MSRPSALVLRFAALALLLPAGASPSAAKGARSERFLLPDGFPPIGKAERELTAVDFAPGAPAVVLLDGEQTEDHDAYQARRVLRRVKILTAAGVHEHADYEVAWWGDVRLADAKARTVLPDGTVIDAADGLHVRQEKDPDSLTITVGFPRVAVGAILDVSYEVRADALPLSEFIVQEELPVLESRFLVAPPSGQRFRAGVAHLSEDQIEHEDFAFGTKRIFAWLFKDVPPLPSVANRPPISDIAAKLTLVNEGYYVFGRQFPYAADWKSLIGHHRDFYDDWLKAKGRRSEALARELLGKPASPRDAAEAVRLALRERFAVLGFSAFPSAESPDEALENGRGRSADAALLSIVMLRAVGVEAYPAAIRLRSSGSIPVDVPVPGLLNDLLVVLPGAGPGGADLSYSPAVDQPVDVPSGERVGVLAVPYVRGAKAPAVLPDLPAEKNAVRRSLSLTPGLDGSLSGSLTWTGTGHHAESWRRALRTRDQDERRRWLEARLDDAVPSLHVGAFEIQGLEQGGADLVVDLQFNADAAVTRASGRLLLNPFLFDRIDAADWAPEKRELDIWLGRPRSSEDLVLIQLPPGVSDVQLPQPLKLDAGPVGRYEVGHSGEGSVLRCTRELRLDQVHFGPGAYEPLKHWFTDMAKGDEQSIVLRLVAP